MKGWGGGLEKLRHKNGQCSEAPGACDVLFSPVSQHQILSNCSYFSPNRQKCSSSLSCWFLFPDSLEKNGMSGHPWHTNLPSIPHLAHLWQQYGLHLFPSLPLQVNMLKQMFYNPSLRHLTLASVYGVYQGLHLVQTVVISCLHYCNALLVAPPAFTMKPLQMGQNLAAHLVLDQPKRARCSLTSIGYPWPSKSNPSH